MTRLCFLRIVRLPGVEFVCYPRLLQWKDVTRNHKSVTSPRVYDCETKIDMSGCCVKRQWSKIL